LRSVSVFVIFRSPVGPFTGPDTAVRPTLERSPIQSSQYQRHVSPESQRAVAVSVAAVRPTFVVPVV
jgi:hypothetical protein